MQLSDWVPYLLVIAVVSLMIAPVMWMQPSPRQKRLAALREKAMAEGMRPELRPAPAELPAMAGEALMTYSLTRSERLRNPPPRRCWLADEQGWSGFEPVPAALAALPSGSLLVEFQDNAARLYWTESASLESIPAIKQVLQQIIE